MINVLHLNIRSFVKNVDNLLMLLDDLRSKGIIIHVIGLCETHLNLNNKDFAQLENYHPVHRCRTDCTGGGVTIFVHETVHTVRRISTPFTNNLESVALELKFKGSCFVVVEFYRPPNCNDDLFLNAFNELLTNIKNYEMVFVCTDQNYDLLKMHLHSKTRNFIELMFEHRLVPYISLPTRVTHSTSTLIDNIYVQNKIPALNYSYVVTDGMSDHYPCLVSYLMKSKCNKKLKVIEKRKINDNSLHSIQQELLFFDWSPIHAMEVNESYCFLVNTITSVLDKIAPLKKIKVKWDDAFNEGWLSVKLKRYNVKCRKLCSTAKDSGLKSDFKKYKSYRNVLNRIKIHEKRSHYKEVFKRIRHNSKLLWNVINGIVKKNHDKTTVTELLVGDKVVREQLEVCEAFNKHFTSAGKNVQNSIRVNNRDPCKNVVSNQNSLKLSRVTESQLCSIVMKMQPKRSSGLDNISNCLLRDLIHVIKYPLCISINKSLMSGTFPDLMKIAKVLPLHKSGDQYLTENYRPISLLPVISKVLERVVYVQTIKFLEENNIIYHKQFGFRKNIPLWMRLPTLWVILLVRLINR